MSKTTPAVLLLILDGWGETPSKENNAIATANTPQWDQWQQQGLVSSLDAAGQSVGLPKLQMGNSEVGHMHIGAGRTIKQDFTQISDDITSGAFYDKTNLLSAIDNAKQNNTAIHLMGLLSEGGVHSHQQHLFALLDAISKQHFAGPIYIHAFLDGRDTPPNSAVDAIKLLQQHLQQHPNAKLASICGRFYAMDRDNRWQRIESAYNLLTQQQTNTIENVQPFLQQSYQQSLFDEFIPATATDAHQPLVDGDLLIFFNFRADRARELSQALTSDQFEYFNRDAQPKINLLTMTQYQPNLQATAIYPPSHPNNTLGECVANAGFKQLRIAETEKYAHVTFFFNGGQESSFQHEDRQLIASPNVKTYDLKPEMSAFELTKALVDAIDSQQYQLIVCNYANADMVGHTGNFKATVQAIEALDQCFKEINNALARTNTELVITADHGNAEKMYDKQTQMAHTAHTTEPVPFVYLGQQSQQLNNVQQPSLTDIAPTILSLLNITVPTEMTGKSLLKLNTTSKHASKDL